MSLPSDTSIVRRQDGSIDIDHYARRALTLRSAAHKEFRVGFKEFVVRTVERIISSTRRGEGRLQQRKTPVVPI